MCRRPGLFASETIHMTIKLQVFFPLAAAMLIVPALRAQNAQQVSSLLPALQSAAPSPSTAGSGAASAAEIFSPATEIMVQNRARTLGNSLSGSGTRYFAATDTDLKGLSPAQALARLSPPPVSAANGVRKLEISINLQQPLIVEARSGQPIDIGTAVVQAAGGVQNVEVHASIFFDGITVLNK
jgi:hypothetical protein